MTPFVTLEAVLDAVPLQDVKRYPNLCETCGTRICVEIRSGEAITLSAEGLPRVDHERCVHCGAGGIHSTEN